MRHREPCGCAADDRAWLTLCPAHFAEWQERHTRAQKEKSRAELLGCYSLGPGETKVVTSEAD